MRALVLGIGGQDGSYLADILLEEGYEVHGLHRRSSVDNLWRVEHCRNSLHLHQGDITEASTLLRIIDDVRPSLIFNEADQDDIRWSHDLPAYAFDVTTKGVINLLEAVRLVDTNIRVFQPCSSSMYADSGYTIAPRSPYAIAKLAAYHVCRYYRERHYLPIVCGVMFNHDSPRRSGGYLLQEVCQQAIAVLHGKQQFISLAQPTAMLDLGYARDYMQIAYRLLTSDALPAMVQVCTGRPITPGGLAQVASDVLGIVLPIQQMNFNPPPSPLVGDPTMLTEVLGEYLHVSIDLLAAMVLDKYKEQYDAGGSH